MVEMPDSLFCGSCVSVSLARCMVVIVRLDYLSDWMIWKTENSSPLMLCTSVLIVFALDEVSKLLSIRSTHQKQYWIAPTICVLEM